MRWEEIEYETEEPEHGAGEPLSAEDAPELLYHGTNPIAAAVIIREGRIRADFPVDDDDLGEVVCTTSQRRIAKMFATEFARLNSEYDVGVVFAINGKRLVDVVETVPFHAETASQNEFEFRVKGDIDNHFFVGIKLVGKRKLLTSARFVEQLCRDALQFGVRISPEDIKELIDAAS